MKSGFSPISLARRGVAALAMMATCMTASLPLMAQPFSLPSDLFTQGVDPQNADPQNNIGPQDIAGEFAFVRLQYDNYYNDGFGYGTWRTDFPSADSNFLRGVSRLTNVRVMSDPIVLRFDDDKIFDYPFLYALEMGRSGGPEFSPKEKENMREYLLRGGFLLIDDFWGTRQWDSFYRAFTDVFPDREIIELQPDHEIFRSYYDIDGPQMIPVIGNPENYPEQDVDRATNHAILDDSGRVMVLINWNSDMGDGWEHTYDPRYPTRHANLAYQLGINYLIYSLTH